MTKTGAVPDGDVARRPVVIFATFTPRSGNEQAVQQGLRDVLPPTRSEPGCLQFDLCASEVAGMTFRLFEVFASEEALDAHKQTEHYRVYRATVIPLLQEPPSVVVMSALDVAGSLLT
jgi:quinol monooxygenase YgiN